MATHEELVAENEALRARIAGLELEVADFETRLHRIIDWASRGGQGVGRLTHPESTGEKHVASVKGSLPA